MENCGSAVVNVIRFLRGRLINHDTPPTPLATRSIPGNYFVNIPNIDIGIPRHRNNNKILQSNYYKIIP
jgi:hypothetical protein